MNYSAQNANVKCGQLVWKCGSSTRSSCLKDAARAGGGLHGGARALRVCSRYLWPASLPREPMLRSGLDGWTQVGSGGFCASVFTSGSISEGDGVSLAPAMPADESRLGGVSGAPGGGTRTDRKPHPASQRGRAEAEGERLPLCRITAGARRASASARGFESSSISDRSAGAAELHAASREARGEARHHQPPRAPQKVT